MEGGGNHLVIQVPNLLHLGAPDANVAREAGKHPRVALNRAPATHLGSNLAETR